ncbi:hypothetical protein GN244_ATG06710 [Phytophthora infestans]|uniref:Uncharacterized protein n=1 Tax=Phytophthora infestans TaxID=4787 RepID=A0A833WLL6_PHYIN|nr:hypothetical protein GN244_ATG06710 [Phytophthora infestans]KAF4127370.1 hypothetical protein GN958_ATG23429 [Phytophthora infestans]
MDANLARVGVSDTALRAHYSNAVCDELQEADKRLQKALAALKRALQVAEASRELHKSSLALVDESPDVSSMISRTAYKSKPLPPRSPSTRKRKAPEHYLAPLALPPVKKVDRWELLEKRLALASQGEHGEKVLSCLLAARNSSPHTSISKLQSTCRELADANDRGSDVASYMDDIQAVLTFMAPCLVGAQVPFGRKELRSILLLLQRLPREFPETAKLRKHIAANFETPAEEVVDVQEQLKKMLKEVRGWCREEPYSVSVFEDRLQFVKKTIEASGYEGYDPRWDKSIAELLFRFGCCLQAFHTGWAQDRRYDTIRSLLSEMKSQERRR